MTLLQEGTDDLGGIFLMEELGDLILVRIQINPRAHFVARRERGSSGITMQ
jgi:hypothetical protein